MATDTEGVKRHRRWRRPLLAGFGCGVAAGAFLEWYFNWGPAAGTPDSGAAHGVWLMLLGSPTTVLAFRAIDVLPLAVSRTLLVLSVGVSWGLLWAAASLLRGRRRTRQGPGRHAPRAAAAHRGPGSILDIPPAGP